MKLKYLLNLMLLFILISCSSDSYKEGTIKEFYLDRLSQDSTLYVQMITKVDSVTKNELKSKEHEVLNVRYKYGVDTVKLLITRGQFDTDKIKVLYTLEVRYRINGIDLY